MNQTLKMKRKRITGLFAALLSIVMIFTLLPLFSNGNNVKAASNASNYGLTENSQDGVILHAWNWSYNTIRQNLSEIAAAGYSTVQTSPVQQPKDYSASSASVSGEWWKFYQPVSFSIAQSSWLGSKSDLTTLCAAADQYGIKIICDIVVNHLANNNGTATSLDTEVAQYEPQIYNNYNQYFHSFVTCNDNSIQNVVQGNIGQPDLNTGDSYVQGRVLSLLKECIDCGVDGFRFDAAKHIETPSDGSYSSSFWTNTVNAAKSYAQSNKGISLYCYGEILNTVGSGRSFSSYTPFMSVTDNKTSDNTTAQITNGSASNAASSYYYSGLASNKLVLWAESHDTFMGNSGSSSYSNTANISTTNINKGWALNASRAGATALYFARPGSASLGNMGTTNWKDPAVVAVNKFHNAFVGNLEYMSSSGSIAMNERYLTSNANKSGAVLVNANGTSSSVSMAVNKIPNGSYKDQISGSTFTVTNGTLSGQIGSTGIAVLRNVNFNDPTTGQTTTGQTTTPPSGTINIYFTNTNNWSNVYIHYWGGSQASTWPGVTMTYVKTNEYNQKIYRATIPGNTTGIIFNNGSGAQTVDVTTNIVNNKGFYITGTGSNGKYTVGTYNYQ